MSNYICSCCGRKYDIAQSGDYQCECGKEFHFEVKTQPVKTEQICPFCKSAIPADALKCAHCGEWLAGKAPKSSTVYLLLAFFFGPWAEFYLGHIIGGFILIMINIGLLALVAVIGPEAFILAGAFQFLYFLYACFVDVNPATVNPAQQNKKSSGGGIWFCWIIIILVFIGIAVALFLNQKNKPAAPEAKIVTVTSNTSNTVTKSVKSVSPAATDPAQGLQKQFQITHDYQIKFDDPFDRFEPDFQPFETNSAGYKVYSVKTNLKMDNRYLVYTDMQGNVLQTVLTIFTSSYNIPEALKNSLVKTILKDTTLKPVVSDGVLKIIDIPDLKNPENKREVSFVTNETNLKITFSLLPLPEIKNPAGKPINGLFGISLGSVNPKYQRDKKTFNPGLVFFTPNKKLPFSNKRRGSYYLSLDHANRIISISASGKFFQKEWETVIRPALKKNFEELYNMTFTETSGGKYGKNGGSYYYVSGNRMLLLSWSWPDSYKVDFDVHVVDHSLLKNDEKWKSEKEQRKMKKLQNSLSLDAENNLSNRPGRRRQ